jgi:hypothetical protein
MYFVVYAVIVYIGKDLFEIRMLRVYAVLYVGVGGVHTTIYGSRLSVGKFPRYRVALRALTS